jgi:PAS domain S-box-containing protein
MPTPPLAVQRQRFRVAFSVVVVMCLSMAFLLGGWTPEAVGQTASGAGMVLSGLVGSISALLAAGRSSGPRRTAWALLGIAGLVAMTGNAWTAATVANPLDPPNELGNLSLTVAMLMSIAAILHFPVMRSRGPQLVLMVLDGVIIGGAALTVATVLVYSQVLEATHSSIGARATALLFPVLDVVLVTLAAMLVARSRADSSLLALVGLGFLVYAVADLAFAAQVAEGTFEFGGFLDLGWIAGNLIIGLAAWHPSAVGDSRPVERASTPGGNAIHPGGDAIYTVMVFVALSLAVGVQVAFGDGRQLSLTQSVLWVCLVCAVGIRQVLLTIDNDTLRRGLQRRVDEQTLDLQRLVRQTEVLLTSVGDGIYGVDSEGHVTFINPSGAEALGFEPARLLGRRAHQEFHAPQEDGSPYPWTDCYVTDAIRRGLVATSEEDVYVRADGSTFPVEITSSPLVDEDRITGAVVVFRDVTQRREVDRIKNEFLSVVSHELRTPLTSIRGSLGLLAGGAAGALSPTAERMTTIALESSERLTRLINDILDVERLQSGTLPMRVGPHSVHALLEASAAELAEAARRADVRIEVGDAPGVALVDPDRIVQTLTNLLGNAVKFSAAGSVVAMEAVLLGDDVLIRVRDRGRGIPEEKLEAVFERFEQVDSSDARIEGGTGLGLAISRGIVERHGGRIWAESTVGVGTTMHVALPAAPASLTSA